MRDYLTNLAARSLEPTPAIQPRLASLFEPLSLVGPLFPRPGRVGDRFETIAARDEAAPDALSQPRADHEPGIGPPISSLPPTLLKIAKEGSNPASSEVPKLVSDQQRKPVATTMNLAEPESRIPEKMADGIRGREQIVSASRRSQEGKAKIVVPVIGVPSSTESSHRDQPGWPEKASDATKNEVAVTLVANTYEARRPTEAARLENELVARRDSESLNESRARDRSTAITPLSQNDQRPSPSQGLVVPRATIETIRADRGPRSPISIPETAAPRDATVSKPIANIKPHKGSRARPTDTGGDEPASPEGQPSVNVTIGRVEVRALLATTSRPSRKDSESPKLMGLDDYLRQRAQGGKR
jgi:hypothetical protein